MTNVMCFFFQSLRGAFATVCTMLCAALLNASALYAVGSSGVFAQLVLTFDSERAYTYSYDRVDHALVLEIQKTSPTELEPINRYDERLIRRVLIRDLGPAGSEIRMILRDKNVRVTVADFKEPFRITIDLYDQNFLDARDTATGLPLSAHPESAADHTAAPPQSDEPRQEHAGATDHTPSPAASKTASSQTEHETPNGRRLLQMPSQLFTDPNELSDNLGKVAAGIGKSWGTYPIYIYRLQTALYTSKDHDKSTEKAPPTVLNSAAAMAQYAGKLFDIGHESRALVAYQQVLHKDARIFEQDASHLWKFAEVHLGQGNLTLAEGYFEALVTKHGEHPLARFARLRALDIRAIRALRTEKIEQLQDLAAAALKINHHGSDELKAQLAIRVAFWRAKSDVATAETTALPPLTDDLRRDLSSSFGGIEGQRTAFLASSLMLADMIRPQATWERDNGPFAAAYFQKFSGKSTEPLRSTLRDNLQTKLNSLLQVKIAAGKFMEAVQDYEALPKALQSIRKTPATAWALGEAYRTLGQKETAISFYDSAVEQAAGPDRFRALFWTAIIAGEVSEQIKSENGSAARITALSKKSAAADRDMGNTWKTLKENERKDLSLALKDPMERTIRASTLLKTPPQIVLSNWTAAFATKVSTTNGGDATDWERNFSPTASAAKLITDLGRRFGELGMTNERRQAIQLLRNVKPASLKQDKDAEKTWAEQLLGLAEEYRTSNDYLEAGRLYSFVGSESTALEGRAEALYKGGLLLYRAGRRDEAIAAFQKAKSDGNNLYYANMADERLSQIEKK